MLRLAVVASVQAVAAALFAVVPVAAATQPSPPPGSVDTQAVGVSSDDQGNPAAFHCGVQAGAAGSAPTVIPPMQVSTGGTSTPAGCGSSAPSGGGAQTSSSGQKTSAAGSGAQARPASSGQAITTTGDAVSAGSVHGAGGSFGGPLWLGLLALLALFLLLIGFVLGRRRPARATA